jgi:hypothetical protein
VLITNKPSKLIMMAVINGGNCIFWLCKAV